MFVNGVSVILTGNKNKYSGMAIAWVSQIEKKHLIISVPKSCEATVLLMEHGTFSVNELGIDQEDIAREFGGHSCIKKANKDKAIIVETDCGLAILNDCRTNIICTTISMNEIEDQVVITAEILKVINKTDMQPMIFIKSNFFNEG